MGDAAFQAKTRLPVGGQRRDIGQIFPTPHHRPFEKRDQPGHRSFLGGVRYCVGDTKIHIVQKPEDRVKMSGMLMEDRPMRI